MAGLDMRGQGIGLGMMGMPDRSLITAVQQKDYSAGVWLRRKDKLEHRHSAMSRELLPVCITRDDESACPLSTQ
ncbi:hypothetical protein NQZ68_003174 [Dissostichus eleginoides]|nr:hypothetical protein NQZ68_003174 [Dissostichus eleginoides]